MKVVWTAQSLSDIEAIVEYIAADDAKAALALAERISGIVENNLPENPNFGWPGRIIGTRELVVHASYLVAYRVKAASVEVLAVRHAKRMWPERF